MKTYFTKPLLDDYMKILKEGKSVVIPVAGTSMEPALDDGIDRVMLEYLSPDLSGFEQIQIGDICLFQRDNGSYALHRVVKKVKEGNLKGQKFVNIENNQPINDISGPCILFRGDNQIAVDIISPDGLRARVIRSFHNGKWYGKYSFYWFFYCFFWARSSACRTCGRQAARFKAQVTSLLRRKKRSTQQGQ